MATQNREEALKCSTSTLMMIYYVIIGLAITEALQNAFIMDGSFIGERAISTANLPRTLLLFALLPTICRFVHGASMHLGLLGEKRFKPLLDFVWFFLQASIFYLMSFSLESPVPFSIFFGVLLLLDVAWLLLLGSIQYVKVGFTEIQWLVSDAAIIVALCGICLARERVGNTVAASLILSVAFLATVLDYAMNREFYFPSRDPSATEALREG